MLITAELRCMNCGRLCGEVEGESARPLRFAAIRPWQGPLPCAPEPGRPLRCRHCGGVSFLDQVRRSRPDDLLAAALRAGRRPRPRGLPGGARP